MRFRVEVRKLDSKSEALREWGYQQDSKTYEGAAKVASQMRHFGMEARVVPLEVPAAPRSPPGEAALVARGVSSGGPGKSNSVLRRVIDLHRAQLAGLVEIRGVAKLRPVYDQSRLELEEKLRRLVRGGKGSTFQAHHVRLVLGQVGVTVREIQGKVYDRLGDTGRVARELAPRHLMDAVERLQEHFKGATPVIQPRQVAVFQRAYEGVAPSLLDHHESSSRLYGPPVIAKVRNQLSLSLVQGEGVEEAIDRVAGAAGIVAGERYRAERIVRTETAYSYGVDKQVGMVQLAQQAPRLMKRLVATFDDRTGDDSVDLNGQTVPVDQPFVWHVKDSHGRPTGKVVRYMQPPNRPNDREVTIPWMSDWPASPVLDAPGGVDPTTRGL